jgi:hypothetical protein
MGDKPTHAALRNYTLCDDECAHRNCSYCNSMGALANHMHYAYTHVWAYTSTHTSIQATGTHVRMHTYTHITRFLGGPRMVVYSGFKVGLITFTGSSGDSCAVTQICLLCFCAVKLDDLYTPKGTVWNTELSVICSSGSQTVEWDSVRLSTYSWKL